jgi:RNA polymerase sigma-70 factor (ECF subfamily)
VARRLSSDAAGAEDLVQETLLLAWKHFGQFRAGTNIRAWLFRILINAFHAQGRKNRAAPVTVSFAASDAGGWPEPAWSASSAGESAEMASALAAVSEEHRTVLLLAIVEGFTCREIAEILSLPIGTVMSRLSRGRQALRAELTPSSRYTERGVS